MHHFTRPRLLGLLGMVWLALSSSAGLAAEGGASLYIPGGAGDIVIASNSPLTSASSALKGRFPI